MCFKYLEKRPNLNLTPNRFDPEVDEELQKVLRKTRA